MRIHYTRPGKGTSVYDEGLVRDDGQCLETYTVLAPADSQGITQAMGGQGMLAAGEVIAAVRKLWFYHEYFTIVQAYDAAGRQLGCYSDIAMPLRREDGEYFMTDLFLDLWLRPGEPPRELDEDEFEAALAAGVITAEQAALARDAWDRLRADVATGAFAARYLRD